MPPLLHSPTSIIISLLERCSSTQELTQVHAQMIKSNLILHTIPTSRLLAAITQNPETPHRSLNYALRLFDTIPSPNAFMWNSIIRACSISTNPESAILLYCQMLHNAAPHNPHTFPFLLKTFTNLSSPLKETQQIHCHVVKRGFAEDIYTANSLLHVYAKGGEVGTVRGLFDRIPMKTIVSWTTMIVGYTNNSLFKEALELFRVMQAVTEIEADAVLLASALSACAHLGALEEGKWIHAYIDRKRIGLDVVLNCALVDMYSKCGELDEALSVFRTARERNLRLWTAMIAGFAIHGRGSEALAMLKEMEGGGIRPNSVTFTTVLAACSHAGLVEEGKLIFDRIARENEMGPSVEHYGCIVDLLARSGHLSEAVETIGAMPMTPNSAVWGALLNGCTTHRNFELGKNVGKILIKSKAGDSCSWRTYSRKKETGRGRRR